MSTVFGLSVLIYRRCLLHLSIVVVVDDRLRLSHCLPLLFKSSLENVALEKVYIVHNQTTTWFYKNVWKGKSLPGSYEKCIQTRIPIFCPQQFSFHTHTRSARSLLPHNSAFWSNFVVKSLRSLSLIANPPHFVPLPIREERFGYKDKVRPRWN